MDLTPWQWFGNVTLTETWRFHVIGDSSKFLALQAWTLCYEEQFYVVSGLVLFATGQRFFGGMIVVTLGVLSIMALRLGNQVTGFFFDGNWLLFAEGVLLYWSLNYGTRAQRLLAAGGLLVLALATLALANPNWWFFTLFVSGQLFPHS